MLFRQNIVWIATVTAALALTGCGEKPAPPAPAAAAKPVVTKKFNAKGVIEEVRTAKNTLLVKHDAIPDYMPAMTMPIEVKPSKDMAGLKPGDIISFVLVDAGNDGWMESIKVLGTTNVTAAPPPETFRKVRNVEPLKIGDFVNDYPFTNELGQAFSLGQYKGSALAVTFIFTRCPFPTFCPRMSENFAGVYEKLSTTPSSPTNWHLLSISFDPEFDTPAVLQKYATKYKYDPKHWNFATGAKIEIDALTEQLGLTFWTDPASGSINHNLRTIIIDAQGRLHKVFVGNEWTPAEFTAEMVKAAEVK